VPSVRYTAGSAGVWLALICAVKGYPLYIVTSDAVAREKLDHMSILGATLQILHSEGGRMTEKLTRDMIEAAGIITKEKSAYWTDQLNNTDQIAAYHVNMTLGVAPSTLQLTPASGTASLVFVSPGSVSTTDCSSSAPLRGSCQVGKLVSARGVALIGRLATRRHR
jgi:Pyridoxal-phosphate dependent enzyme